mmetsp:Transcript_47960/g.71043  ORF Transcript_47960/g.71043 Transcript_47960/m.71043 type:complete len:574 (+) Transcript_47960:355-2076(+)
MVFHVVGAIAEHSEAESAVHVQEVLDEVHGAAREPRGEREHLGGVDDLDEDSRLVRVHERGATADELVDQDAQGPVVDAPVVTLGQDELRRQVFGSAAKGVGLDAVLQLLGEAEVSDLEVSVRIDEKILGFEVAVGVLLLVDVCETGRDARSVHAGVVLADALRQRRRLAVREHLLLVQKAPQLAALNDLEEHVQLVGILERAQKLEDEGVVHGGHALLLGDDVLLLLRLHDVGLVQALHGDDLPGLLVLAQLHAAEGARADGSDDLEVVEGAHVLLGDGGGLSGAGLDLLLEFAVAPLVDLGDQTLEGAEHGLELGLRQREAHGVDVGRAGGIAHVVVLEGGFAEEVAGAQLRDLDVVLGHPHHTLGDDVERVPLLAFADDDVAGGHGDLAHRLGDLQDVVVGELLEERDLAQELAATDALAGRVGREGHLERLTVDFPQHAVGRGEDGGRAGAVVHEGELAEGSGRGDLANALLVHDDVHSALLEHEEEVSLLALLDDLGALAAVGLLHGVHQLLLGFRAESVEKEVVAERIADDGAAGVRLGVVLERETLRIVRLVGDVLTAECLLHGGS